MEDQPLALETRENRLKECSGTIQSPAGLEVLLEAQREVILEVHELKESKFDLVCK